LEGNLLEVECADESRSSRVRPVEVSDELVGVDVRGRFPRVVFCPKALPLDQVLESTSVDSAVEDLFNFPVFLLAYDDRVWWWLCAAIRDGIQRRGRQLDHIEDWVESLHRPRETNPIGVGVDLLLHWVRAEALMGQLP
jgi:hypothetical protein